MNNLTPIPGWDSVPQLENDTLAQGGPGGIMNAQAQALLDRTEYIKEGKTAFVSAIASVDAASLVDGMVVIANGRSAAGDGGGGEFAYSASSTQTVDGGFVFAPASGTGRLIRSGWTIFGFIGSVKPQWFGAVGNGTAVDRTAIQNAINAILPTGGAIEFSGRYNFGQLSANQFAVSIPSPSNIKLIGNRAVFICTTIGTAGTEAKSAFFHVSNPSNFEATGIKFYDGGFTFPTSTDRRFGAYGFIFTAGLGGAFTEANPSRGVRIDCDAENMVGLSTFDAVNQFGQGMGSNYALQGVYIRGTCHNTYYGVGNTYAVKGMNVDLQCHNVKRGLISYAARDCFAKLTLNCDSGFLGSNAFVELAYEASANTTLDNCDIDVMVRGCEAHGSYVTFYHQQDSGDAGSISNIRANVRCSGLSTTGKNALVGSTYMFNFRSEDSGGNVKASTSRTFDNIKLGGGIVGSISGSPILLSSMPATKGALEIDGNLSMAFSALGAAYVTSLFSAFNINGCHFAGSFSPVIQGGTTSGTATYSAQNGYYEIINGRCHFDIQLAWSGATGTGQLQIGGLPVPWNKSRSGGNNNPVVGAFGLPAGSGSVARALMAGNGTWAYCYIEQQTSGVTSVMPVPTSGNAWLSGSFPV